MLFVIIECISFGHFCWSIKLFVDRLKLKMSNFEKKSITKIERKNKNCPNITIQVVTWHLSVPNISSLFCSTISLFYFIIFFLPFAAFWLLFFSIWPILRIILIYSKKKKERKNRKTKSIVQMLFTLDCIYSFIDWTKQKLNDHRKK